MSGPHVNITVIIAQKNQSYSFMVLLKTIKRLQWYILKLSGWVGENERCCYELLQCSFEGLKFHEGP